VEHVKRVGPKASALKYDLLTALTVTGLHGTPTEQTSCLRLTALITARYNWRLDEVCVGHEALAQMWAVNTRTVKREMKRLMDWGVLLCIRPGVRGRVGAYRLNYARIYELSRPVWAQVGPAPAFGCRSGRAGTGGLGRGAPCVAGAGCRGLRELVCKVGGGPADRRYLGPEGAKFFRCPLYRDTFCPQVGRGR